MPEENKPLVFLGFDFGEKRIGVAVGQSLTKTARPLTTLMAKEGIPEWDEVTALIETWKPEAIIVGIPLNMDGTEQAVTHAARDFANRLRQRYSLTVYDMDERLSTREARAEIYAEGGYKSLKKRPVDDVAARL